MTFRSLVPIHGHPEAQVLEELQGVGVPMRFADDGMSISIDHDGTPPVAGRLDCRDLPDMVPILSTLASRARGRTVLSHVSHVRLKESDRVASMLQLRKMGARVEFDGNDMEFEGVDRLYGAELSSFNDHRVLMALAIAGSTAEGVTELSYPHAYRISYPGVPRPHERDRDPGRRHAAGAHLGAGLILDDLEAHAEAHPRRTSRAGGRRRRADARDDLGATAAGL